jgi:hypothetical protein
MFATGVFPIWAITISCCPVVFTIFGFVFLLVFDRDKLQSEEFQIKKMSLEIIEQKGDPGPTLATDIREIISDPTPPQLPENTGNQA